MGKVKALFDKSVRFVCGWARRWNDLYWLVACLWLVSLGWDLVLVLKMR